MNGKFQCINEIVALRPIHRLICRTGVPPGRQLPLLAAGDDPSSGLAIGDDNAVPEQFDKRAPRCPGARVLPSGGDTDRMAELFKQAGVTTIAEFNYSKRPGLRPARAGAAQAAAQGLPGQDRRGLTFVAAAARELPPGVHRDPRRLGHILCGNQPMRRCTRLVFTKSCLGDGAAVAGSVERRGNRHRQCHRAGVASMARGGGGSCD